MHKCMHKWELIKYFVDNYVKITTNRIGNSGNKELITLNIHLPKLKPL